MRVLVTGGAGFIGSHVVDLLLSEGFEVAVVDNLSTGRAAHLNHKARFYQHGLDLADLERTFAIERPEVVIHHAAQIDVRRSVADPLRDAQVNILGSLAVLEACRACGTRKVVYASSAALYGDPIRLPVDEAHPVLATSPYGVSKHTVEHYLEVYRQLHGLEYTALRYANAYGPRQDPLGEGGVVAIFSDRIAKGLRPVIYGDGQQTRDFVYVGDIARANLLALERGHGCAVNISSGRETTVNELWQLMQMVSGTRLEPEYRPERPGEIRRSVLANQLAKERLGWAPQTALADGLAQVFAHLRAA